MLNSLSFHWLEMKVKVMKLLTWMPQQSLHAHGKLWSPFFVHSRGITEADGDLLFAHRPEYHNSWVHLFQLLQVWALTANALLWHLKTTPFPWDGQRYRTGSTHTEILIHFRLPSQGISKKPWCNLKIDLDLNMQLQQWMQLKHGTFNNEHCLYRYVLLWK